MTLVGRGRLRESLVPTLRSSGAVLYERNVVVRDPYPPFRRVAALEGRDAASASNLTPHPRSSDGEGRVMKGRDVGNPAVTGSALHSRWVTPVRPGPPRTEQELLRILSAHGVLDPSDIEHRLEAWLQRERNSR